MDLAAELYDAIKGGCLVPYFQPIVELRTGSLVGYELLARWNHPIRGLMPPSEFIPLVEAAHLMPAMTESLLVQAIDSWKEFSLRAGLSINISPSQLRDKGLLATLERVASERCFPLDLLTIEITESALLDDIDEARKAAEDLRKLGCKLALDDFGTGYSSLSHLQKLPFSSLKIDQSFVRSMIQRREDRKIVGAVVGLGNSLGLKLVAEGIENKAQAEMLLCLGCEYGQGWLYGKPVPAHVLVDNLQMHSMPDPGIGAMEHVDPFVCREALPAQTQSQVKAIYDGVPVGLSFLDCNFRYVNLNQRLASMNGVSIDEHLGRTPQEVIPKLFKEIEPYLLKARAGEAVANVKIHRIALADGCLGAALASYQPAFDESGEVVGILVSVTDIADRKSTYVSMKNAEAILHGWWKAILGFRRPQMQMIHQKISGLHLVSKTPAPKTVEVY